MDTDGSELKKLLLTNENAVAENKTERENEETLDSLFFYEDEVYKVDRNGRVKFGLIVDSETYSDDEDDSHSLNKGEVCVSWYPEGHEYIEPEEELGLADRSLMPGDMVRRLEPGQNTQRGFCREIKMKADVKVLGTKYVIKNVSSDRFRLLSKWQRDNAVSLDSWVGTIKEVEDKAILRAASGTRIEVSHSDFEAFKEATALGSRSVFCAHIFYPGNVILGPLRAIDKIKLLTPKNALPTNKKGKPLVIKFTVESTYTDKIWVLWQYRALSDPSDSNPLQQPNSCITGEDLNRTRRLNLFETCTVQINDRNFLKFSSKDEVVKKTYYDREQDAKFAGMMLEKEENDNIFDPLSDPPNHSKELKINKKAKASESVKMKKSKLPNVDGKQKYSSAESINCSTLRSKSDSIEMMSDGDDRLDGQNLKSTENEDDDSEIETVTANCVKTITSSRSYCKNSPTSSKQGNRSKLKHQTSKTSKNTDLASTVNFKIDEELITEVLHVHSIVTVVWQDGTIESNIPSTALYPIHHVDNHEFFPGDYIVSDKDVCNIPHVDYGVIQNVDHHGRTARVKWFAAYSISDEPRPECKGESEVSVYDLKDHPDFQYRPGAMVIRVGNFAGENATCTAGQVLDNDIDGRSKVWWVDGHISMCWPQDLYEVTQIDHTDHQSDGSWETESESSEVGYGNNTKTVFNGSQILLNIERAKEAVVRLEELLNASSNFKSQHVMSQLLKVYKGCRYMDRLMITNYFHEDHFAGLIERVSKSCTQSEPEGTQVRQTLHSNDQQSSSVNAKREQDPRQSQAILSSNNSQKLQAGTSLTPIDKESDHKVMNVSSTPLKCTSSSEAVSISFDGTNLAGISETKSAPMTTALDDANKEITTTTPKSLTQECNTPTSVEPPPGDQNSFNTEQNELLTSAMLNIEKAFEQTGQLKNVLGDNVSSQDDSGNYSIPNGDPISNSYASSSDLTNAETNNSSTKPNDDQCSMSCNSIELIDDLSPELVCIRLCALLRTQLVHCVTEIRKNYFPDDHFTLTEYDAGDDESSQETVVEKYKTKKSETTDNNYDDQKIAMVLQKSYLEKAVPNPIESTDTLSVSSDTFVVPDECFQILSNAPKTHKYYNNTFYPNNTQQYFRAIQKEHRMLQHSMPPGVWVRFFEDRIDLLSVMIEGPKKTPYEDGIFFFDLQLGPDYPRNPPVCHYISYCTDRLNPNLYEEGKVCVSLLGTWSGRDTEVWGPNSTLLQVIVSIQGLILVPEPYFNEAGYEKQKGTQQGKENSRTYNEMVLIKLVQSSIKQLENAPELFKEKLIDHFMKNGKSMHSRITGWMELSLPNATEETNKDITKNVTSTIDERQNGPGCSMDTAIQYSPPDFPLLPASRGCCISLSGLLHAFKSKIDKLYRCESDSSNDVNLSLSENVTETVKMEP